MRYGLGAAYLRQPPPQYGRWSSDGAAMTGPLPAVPLRNSRSMRHRRGSRPAGTAVRRISGYRKDASTVCDR